MNKKIKQQLNLSIPSGLEYIIIALISMVDTFAISSFGSMTIAAVGAMVSIIHFFNLGLKSVQVASNVTIAQAIGSNEDKKVKEVTGTSIFLAMIIQIICIVVTIIVSPFLPQIFKVSDICLTYLYIRLIGLIPAGVSMIIAGQQRTLGKSKFVMNVRLLSLILNIVLDYIAIKLNYGVAGVAWATVIIEIINMTILIIYSKGTIIYKINKNYIKELLKLIKYGILDRIFDRGGKLILNIILSRIGTYEYAAHIILNQIEDFVNDFCYGFGIGITTNIGISIGKNNKKEINEMRLIINKIIYVFSIIIPIIICIILIITLPILLVDKEALIIGYKLIPLVLIYSFLLPIQCKYSSIIEGMKEFKYRANISGITNIAKILLSYILCAYLGISGVWIAFCITSIIIIFILKRKVDSNIRNIS